jgi:hypothetical protein
MKVIIKETAQCTKLFTDFGIGDIVVSSNGQKNIGVKINSDSIRWFTVNGGQKGVPSNISYVTPGRSYIDPVNVTLTVEI